MREGGAHAQHGRVRGYTLSEQGSDDVSHGTAGVFPATSETSHPPTASRRVPPSLYERGFPVGATPVPVEG
jgi:hypothetical protein